MLSSRATPHETAAEFSCGRGPDTGLTYTITLPRTVLEKVCRQSSIIGNLYLCGIGYNTLSGHERKIYPKGISEHVFIYCNNGIGRVKIYKTAHELKAGNFILIPAKTPFSYAPAQLSSQTFCYIHFKGIAADTICTQLRAKNKYHGAVESPVKTIEIFNEILAKLHRNFCNDTLIYASMSLQYLLTTALFSDKMKPNWQFDHADEVTQAINLFQSNIDQSLTIQQLADHVNLPVTRLSYLIKQRTGSSPRDYLNQLKMNKACEYLTSTKLKAKEIAGLIGIKDQHYFSRLFTQTIGLSPIKYRFINRLQ